MPLEFRYTPTVSHKNERIAVVTSLTIAAVALLFRMLDIMRLVSQLAFMAAASLAIFFYIRYFHYSYTYRLTEDSLFEVVRIDGKRIRIMLSVPLASVAECRVVRYKEKPKKAFSFLPDLCPDEILLVALSDGMASRFVMLDAAPAFGDEFRRRVYAAGCEGYRDVGTAE